jgi:hypothetical protein
MNKFSIEDGLAIVAAGIVLVGVFFAAEDALAGTDVRDQEAQTRLPARILNKEEATRQAEMAERAAESILTATELELDIRLGNHTSTVRAEQ